MVKPRREVSVSESSPQFFKVYLPDQSSHRLRIPPEFVKYVNGVLPYKYTITSPEKRSWRVELNKVDDNLYFRQGWQQFVQDNSLEFGDFLVFSYGGNAKFYVKIYGKNGCQKEVTAPTLPEENQTVEKRKFKRLAREANSEDIAEKKLRSRVLLPIQEDESAIKQASTFVSEFPFFKVVMTPTYVDRALVNIRTSFVESYMEQDRRSVTLITSDKSWPVKLTKYPGPIWRFTQGWIIFSRDNKLKVGDVCVFELIERNDPVVRVSIFRCPA